MKKTNNFRPNIETIRRFINKDNDLEYKLGLLYLDYKYPCKKKEMERSRLFWAWWMKHRESIALCVLDSVGMTTEDREIEPTTLEALKEAYEYHFSVTIIYKAYPSPKIMKEVIKEGRSKLKETENTLENAR